MEALRSRDQGRGRIAFVDIDAADYDPAAYAGISYREAMGRMHAITADGRVIQDVAVSGRPIGWWGWAGCTHPPHGHSWGLWRMASTDSGLIGG